MLPPPPWDLQLVLRALQEVPFEPLESVDLKFLTLKVFFWWRLRLPDVLVNWGLF